LTTFAYVALDPAGKKKSGQIEAKDKDTAIAAVLADGKYVVEITETKPKSSAPAFGQSKSVSKADPALFSRRLADLAPAGWPSDPVLQVVAQQSQFTNLG